MAATANKLIIAAVVVYASAVSFAHAGATYAPGGPFQSIGDAWSAAEKACDPLAKTKPFKWQRQEVLITQLTNAGRGEIVRVAAEADVEHEDPADKIAHIAAYAVQDINDAAAACVDMAGGK